MSEEEKKENEKNKQEVPHYYSPKEEPQTRPPIDIYEKKKKSNAPEDQFWAIGKTLPWLRIRADLRPAIFLPSDSFFLTCFFQKSLLFAG